MTENNATTGGALYAGSNSILAFDNSIAWGNEATQETSAYVSQSNMSAVHSVVEGGHGDLPDADPLFADPLHNDFRLRVGSPFVDAGDPAKVGVLSIDYHGISRSEDAAPDLGLFEGAADVVDLGGTIGYSGVVDSGPFRVWLMDQSGIRVKESEMLTPVLTLSSWSVAIVTRPSGMPTRTVGPTKRPLGLPSSQSDSNQRLPQ